MTLKNILAKPVAADLPVENLLQFQNLAVPTAIERADSPASSSGGLLHPRGPAIHETQGGHLHRLHTKRFVPDGEECIQTRRSAWRSDAMQASSRFLNTKSNEGMTALHVAVRSQNASLVHYLLDHGARVDIVDASGRTPLDVLNGVPALLPAVFADTEGVVPKAAATSAPPPAPAPAAGGRGGRGGGAAGNPEAVQEIRTAAAERIPKPAKIAATATS